MWIDALPFAQHLDVFGLIIVGFLVEKHYISRPAVFANVIAVNLHFMENPTSQDLFIWYSNIGIIFGAIAIYSYANKTTLSGSYYTVAMYLYSSITVAFVILISLF